MISTEPAPVGGDTPHHDDRSDGAGPARRTLAEVLVGAGGLVVATWTAVLTVVASAFLAPLRIGPVPVPLCWAMVAAGTAGAVWLARFTVRHRLAVLVPAAGWLAALVPLMGRRPEGDFVVPGTWVGYGLLLIGAVTLSSGVFLSLASRPSPR